MKTTLKISIHRLTTVLLIVTIVAISLPLSVNAQIIPSLSDVYFADNQTVIAVGKSGNILKSTDTGSTWTQIACPVNEDLNGVKLNGSLGIVVGNKGTILQSMNYGVNWTKVNSNVTSKDLTDLEILSNTKIIAIGKDSIMLVSNNSGESWEAFGSISCSYNFDDLSFMDLNNGILIAGGTIYGTTDGGSSWKNIKPSSISGHHTAWSNLHCCSYSSDLMVIGENFNTKISINPTGIEYYDAIWYKIGSANFVEKKGTFRKCYDKTCTGTYYIQDIRILPDNKFLAVGDDGLIVKIENNGANWSYKNSGTTKSLTAVSYSGNNCIAVGNGVILKSTDSGDTWSTITSIIQSGTEDYNNDNPFKIFPNPVENIISIIHSGNLPTTVVIYSIEGKLVRQELVKENQIDISNLSKGIYILRLTNQEGTIDRRIIKK